LLVLLAGGAAAESPLSSADLDRVTAGAFGLPDWTSLSGVLITLTSSGSASSSPDSQAATFGLGEAGLIGAARLGEYHSVVQFLGTP